MSEPLPDFPPVALDQFHDASARPQFSRSTPDIPLGGLLPPVRRNSNLPVGIAPESTPEPAEPTLNVPPPRQGGLSGLLWDVVKPTRSKGAVLAGLCSLLAGTYGLNLVVPTDLSSKTVAIEETDHGRRGIASMPMPDVAEERDAFPTIELTKSTEVLPETPTLPDLPSAQPTQNEVLPPAPEQDRTLPKVDHLTIRQPETPALPKPDTTTLPAIADNTLPLAPPEKKLELEEPTIRLVAGEGVLPPALPPVPPPVAQPEKSLPSPGPALPEIGALPMEDKTPIPSTPDLPTPGLPALPASNDTPLSPRPVTLGEQPALPMPTPGVSPDSAVSPLPSLEEKKPAEEPTRPLTLPKPDEIIPNEDLTRPSITAPTLPTLPMNETAKPTLELPGMNTGRESDVPARPANEPTLPTSPSELGAPPSLSPTPVAPVGEVKPTKIETDFDVDIIRIRGGDTYEKLAELHYSSREFADALRAFNKGIDLRTARDIELPPLYVLRQNPAPQPRLGPPTAPSGILGPVLDVPVQEGNAPLDWGSSTQKKPALELETYTVPSAGLTVRDVAETVYGDAQMWQRLTNQAGQQLDPNSELPKGYKLVYPSTSINWR